MLLLWAEVRHAYAATLESYLTLLAKLKYMHPLGLSLLSVRCVPITKAHTYSAK